VGEGRGEVGRMKGESELEMKTVASLKLTDQTNTHLTLSTQNNILHSQIESLESSLQTDSNTLSSYALSLSRAEERIKELEDEAREAEGVRRKLHNMVQELKGNIRVFCRVRPVLALEGEGEERADIRYPDRRDRREIVLESTSESAMGQERKEVYNFGFDRVRPLPFTTYVCINA
jgi:kinesin family protein C1